MIRRHDDGAAAVDEPEVVVLGVRPGHTPSEREPVRIFLGTEPAQHRAERVFVWSIEQVRDPARVYEIHLMRSLAGFETRGWTTGFTNYRFAIPHFAHARGRAIYNDVDQIYLADPGHLYDLELWGHTALAVAANDLSVALLDCERAARLWSLADAQRSSKRELLARARSVPDAIGALERIWNLRDELPRNGEGGVLHYTTLHTQPWRPFPERYVYQEDACGELWHALEHSADAAGFQVFTRERPSRRYAERPPQSLEEVPDEDLPWRLDELLRASRDEVTLRLRASDERPPRWWRERIEAASRRHPAVSLDVEIDDARGPAEIVSAGPRRTAEPPRVWVLADDRPGNTTQALGLAEALGWPADVKQLRCRLPSMLHNRLLGASIAGIDRAHSSPLDPPWPDLVIAAGRRTAPVARWVREHAARAGHAVRIVQLGRKGGDWPEPFDLVVTPSYCRLLAHPRRVQTSAPLHRVTRERLAAAAQQWEPLFALAARPRIAVLVGGDSGQYRLDAGAARRLGTAASAMACSLGGSLLVTTSRRCTPAAEDALLGSLEGAAFVHRWSDRGVENPYLGMLALADRIIVTGDSESMLAEATSLGRPVHIFPLPERRSFRVLRALRELVAARALARPLGERATGRPQQGIELLCARLIERGFVRPTRDLGLLHAELVRRGRAELMPDEMQAIASAQASAARSAGASPDMEQVVARVRELMGWAAPCAS